LISAVGGRLVMSTRLANQLGSAEPREDRHRVAALSVLIRPDQPFPYQPSRLTASMCPHRMPLSQAGAIGEVPRHLGRGRISKRRESEPMISAAVRIWGRKASGACRV
jgi:hypothetical protein